ncbi:MAG: hypothetical protein PVI57_20505, partial [Gemmatimonadota bacterium]
MGRGTMGIGAAAVAAVLWATTAGDLAGQDRTLRWSDAMAAGTTLEVRGISGDVRATRADGSTAEVVATKRGDRDDFDEVEILVLDEGDDVVVCAVYGRRSPRSCDHEDWDDRDDRWD